LSNYLINLGIEFDKVLIYNSNLILNI